MHEMSLCLNMMDLIEEHAHKHHARRVTAVWLEVGALSCIEEHALRFGFEVACRSTVAEGCRLWLDYKLAPAWCWDCCVSVEVDRHDAACPQCGGHALKIDGGDSLRITQMEVE